MRSLRVLMRLVLGACASACLASTLLLLWPFAGLTGSLPRTRSRFTQHWASWLGHVIGMRVHCRGSVPEGPVLLVTNHVSYVDILLIGGRLPCAFISKAEVASWPGLGFLSRLAGTLFVDRERRRDVLRVGNLIQGTLADGRAVVFFPEGTSTSGDEVAPFRSSLLEPAASLGLPVYYAALRYRTPAGEEEARTAVAWWGDMGFLGHFLKLLGMPHFDAEIVFGEMPIQCNERKQLGRELHTAIVGAFESLTSETPGIESGSRPSVGVSCGSS